MNRFLLIATLIGIAGCATPGQEQGQPQSLQALESTGAALPDSDHSTAGDESQAPESRDGIEDIDAPNAGETPVAMLPPSTEWDIVCTREVATGSILKTKVCRRRSEIEAQRESDQRELRRIKTEIAVGTPRPGMGPGQY